METGDERQKQCWIDSIEYAVHSTIGLGSSAAVLHNRTESIHRSSLEGLELNC